MIDSESFDWNLQAGTATDLFEHGRVIISSLEVVPGSASKQQYIHWQRCMGAKEWDSTYGEEGDGLSDCAGRGQDRGGQAPVRRQGHLGDGHGRSAPRR